MLGARLGTAGSDSATPAAAQQDTRVNLDLCDSEGCLAAIPRYLAAPAEMPESAFLIYQEQTECTGNRRYIPAWRTHHCCGSSGRKAASPADNCLPCLLHCHCLMLLMI